MEASLYQAAASTFEELGFLLPNRELEAGQREASPDAAVEVAFQGPVNGVLTLRVCGGILPGLAANMLGQDEAPEPRIQQDALGEVANVICGNLLPAVAGPTAAFRLDAPRALPLDAAAAAFALRATASTTFGLDEGRADVWVAVEETAVA